MVEGDCVVIVPEGNSDEMCEYRVENGELVPHDAKGDIINIYEKIEALSASTQDLTERVETLEGDVQDIKDKIGKPEDIPEKAAVEYTNADFDEGRITVFGFINASNDYGYNLEDSE